MAHKQALEQGTRKYWIGVACREHVQRGVAGGFAQACHGKCAPLKRTRPGDGIIYYSPKFKINDPTSLCKKFTAIGTVKNAEPYQVTVSEDMKPFRIDVDFHQTFKEVSLDSVKKHVGFLSKLRFGFAEISEADFNLICDLML